MAKEKRSIKVKAIVNLKYDKDVIKIDQEFLVRKSDVEEIKEYVEVLDKINTEEEDSGKEDGEGTEEGE